MSHVPERELSVVICTLNEAGAIGPTLRELLGRLEDIDAEVIVVDDASTDCTPEAVRAVGDSRVRLIERQGERGLASAAIAGWDAAAGRWLAIMDGDGQHNPALIPAMLERARAGGVELATSSRYAEAGPSGLTGWRHRVSRAGTWAAGLALRAPLTDPMAGCFLMSRAFYASVRPRLAGVGFKILVDLVASAKTPPRFVEVPTALRSRLAGESKLDLRVAADLAALVVDKRSGGLIPARFVLFAGVGCGGVVVQLAAFAGLQSLGLDFLAAQALAILMAMTSNFALNNMLTFRDRRLRGWALLGGWVTFATGCAAGAVANLSIAGGFEGIGLWEPLASGLGAVAGGVWNFWMARWMTWRIGGPPHRT